MSIKNVKLSVCLPFVTLCCCLRQWRHGHRLVRDQSPVAVSCLYWRQIPFAANALVVFWAKVKQLYEITTVSLHRILNS